MKPRIGLLGLVMVILLSLLLPATTAFASQRTSTVDLYPYDSSAGLAGGAPIGTLTVTVSTGPAGSALVSGWANGTVSGHTYALNVLRRDTVVSFAYFTGVDGTTNLAGLPLAKAPTNGLRFELADVTAGVVVALSDPVKY